MNDTSPSPILQAIAGHMSAKYLYVASELGLFEALANGINSLHELSQKAAVPPRSLRIVLDALVAVGFLKRQGDHYQNTPVTAAFLSGQSPEDFRPILRLWDKVVYPQWATLENAIRTGGRTYGLPEFSEKEHAAFNTGVAALTTPSAKALAKQYDFSRHRQVLDVAGGLGMFLSEAIRQHPTVRGTLFELPTAANAARNHFISTGAGQGITVVEGDVLHDEIPTGYDAIIVANIFHLFSPQTNNALLTRLRGAAGNGAILLAVDFWTNATHTEPTFAALMAGEFHIVTGEGDVYSTEEMSSWLANNNWRMLEHKPLAGPASLIVAEAT